MPADDLEGRVLPCDEAAAVHYAEIVAARRRESRPIEAFDAQIAATARVAGAGLATRDTGDSLASDLTVINRGLLRDGVHLAPEMQCTTTSSVAE